MRRARLIIIVVAIVLSLSFVRPAFTAYASPYEIRLLMFRTLNFFNDIIDTSSQGGTNIPQPTPIPPNTNPPLPSGACPFQAIATIRECLNNNCTTSRSITDFDNSQLYGVANDLRIKNQGDAPDPTTPFGHAGKPGEVQIIDGNQPFPTADGFQRGDPADVKVFLDANRDGLIDNDWGIVAKTCESTGSIDACPNGGKSYTSTNAPLDTIFSMVIDCNVNVRYGWFLKKTNIPTLPASPTPQPTQAQGQQSLTPTVPISKSPIFPTVESTFAPSENPQPTGTQRGITTEEVKSIIDSLSQQSITTNLENLVDDNTTPEKDNLQTRYSTSSGFQTESDYVKQYFDNLGIETQFQNFSVSGGQTRNIIATIPGSGSHKDEYYLVTAHLDSTSKNSGPGNDPAPGADDNGSGSVAVMEIAKALKQSGKSFDYSLQFILFSGEEEGLLGSKYYTSNLSKNIKGVINLDMISWAKNPANECMTIGYRNYDGGNIIADLVKNINDTHSIGLEMRVGPSSIEASDHAPFWYKNITAIFGYECELLTSGGVSNPHYHKVTDRTDYISFSQLTKAAKSVAGAVATLASQ